MIKIILESKFIRKLVKFGIVGALSFLAGYLTYVVFCELHLIFYRDVKKYYLLYQILGSFVGFLVSYYVNKNWTFRHQTQKGKKYFGRFTVVYVIGFLINIGLVYYIVDVADYLEGLLSTFIYEKRLFWAPVVATVVSSAINFLTSNKLVFRVQDLDEE